MDLNDELMLRVKNMMADRGESLRDVVEAVPRTHLRTNAYRLQWHVEQGRMMPGVRLDDYEALFDLMEGRR
jgi:hypothetical protein